MPPIGTTKATTLSGQIRYSKDGRTIRSHKPRRCGLRHDGGYATARPLIPLRRCDRRHEPQLACATRAVMWISGGRPYTHVGGAVVAGRLFLVELNGGGNHLVPMSRSQPFDVARPLAEYLPKTWPQRTPSWRAPRELLWRWSLALISCAGQSAGAARPSSWCVQFRCCILRQLGWAPEGPPMPAPDAVMAGPR